MSTRTNGLLYADYARAMKAAKKFGAKTVRVEPDGAISFSFDDEGLAATDALEKFDANIVRTEAGGYALKSAKPKLHW
jgi:hypothetical protein